MFIYSSAGLPPIPPHKSQTEKPQVGVGGGGGRWAVDGGVGRGQWLRKLLSTDNRSPKIPQQKSKNRTRDVNMMEVCCVYL